LLGSDSTQLANGNKAFDEVLAKYPGHPLANYVRLVKGVNAGRDFKLVIPNKTKIDLRKADHQQTIEMMIALEKGAPEIGLDPITVNQARSYLSDSQKKIGDEAAAAATDKRKAASEKKAAAVGRSAA
jgi:hypothetical protein